MSSYQFNKEQFKKELIGRVLRSSGNVKMGQTVFIIDKYRAAQYDKQKYGFQNQITRSFI